MYRILITDPISDHGLKILEHDDLEVIYKPDISEDELEVVISNINAWIIRSGTQITANHFKEANKQ